MNEVEEALRIAEKTTYINESFQYLKNVSIKEWDIKSAGLSVLKFRKLLPEDELEELSKMEKHKRTVREGLLQKEHPEIAKTIINTLAAARKAFVLLNHLTENNIVSIKKDALFILNANITHPIIKEYFEFREKESYTSWLRIEKKELYYDSFSDRLDIKGVSEENIEKQKDFLIKDIKTFLRSSEKTTSEILFNLLSKYRYKYLNKELPLETYRELDSGGFRLKGFIVDEIDEELLNDIDISQNYLNYILPIIQCLI